MCNQEKTDGKMPLAKWLPLLGLTCAAFVFNTSEFVPIGLLTDIAAEFSLTEARAGLLISVYAWVVMLLSLPLMILASRFDLRRLMLWMVGLFSVFQVCSFLSVSYGTLMLSRIGVACTHSVFWSIVSPMAVRMVPQRYRQVALSLIVTGTSVAMIFGLPLGRVVGLLVGWRMTFLGVGIVGAVTFVYLLFTLPSLPSVDRFRFGQFPALLHNRTLVGIWLFSFVLATAYYTGYSYIEPFLGQVAHFSSGLVTAVLMIFGGAGIFGSMAFSKFYVRYRCGFVSIATLAMAAALFMLWPLACSVVAVVALCAMWGASATAFNVAMQSEVINVSTAESTSVAMSVFSGIFNLGIGLGALAGGAVCTLLSISWIGIAGGVVAVAAWAFWQCDLSRRLRLLHKR